MTDTVRIWIGSTAYEYKLTQNADVVSKQEKNTLSTAAIGLH
jgi:hypothetical protein